MASLDDCECHLEGVKCPYHGTTAFEREQKEAARFRPGVYAHYKGGRYLALFLVEDSTNRLSENGTGIILDSTQKPMVVYVSMDAGPHQGHKCVRDLDQWNEWVDPSGEVYAEAGQLPEFVQRRFSLVEERP